MTVVARIKQVPGGYAYFPPDVTGLKRNDGTPSQPGDVLSAQPDGTLQTRPATAVGAWETFSIQGPYFSYPTDGVNTVLILPPGV